MGGCLRMRDVPGLTKPKEALASSGATGVVPGTFRVGRFPAGILKPRQGGIKG